MIAKFDGECPACGDEIEAGFDEIVKDEAEDAWIHRGCA